MKFLTLNNGYEMPILGLGTFQAEKGKIKYIVENAINLGYKSIDCAWLYGNEKEIGDALEFELKDGKIKREELFITSKLWNTFHHPKHVSVGFNESLNNLKLDYLDLYLIHWPLSMKFGSTFPAREEDFDDVDSIATWKEMEKLVDSKKVKSIGLSNFNIRQIQYILDHCRIKPAVLQIELHVYLQNKKLVDFCLENGIQVTAYSPLGGDFTLPEGTRKPIDDPRVIEIATKYNASPAQILLSYIMHRGISCIPKSSSVERLEENIKSTKLELSDEDFHVLENFNVNFRMVSPKIMSENQSSSNHPTFGGHSVRNFEHAPKLSATREDRATTATNWSETYHSLQRKFQLLVREMEHLKEQNEALTTQNVVLKFHNDRMDEEILCMQYELKLLSNKYPQLCGPGSTNLQSTSGRRPPTKQTPLPVTRIIGEINLVSDDDDV